MTPRRLALLPVVLLAAGPLRAQTAAKPAVGGLAAAAATITGDDVARRIGIIADDSMMGRDTPSRGLELTGQVRRRPVPPLRAQAGRRQRRLVSALSHHPAAVAAAAAPGGVPGRPR